MKSTISRCAVAMVLVIACLGFCTSLSAAATVTVACANGVAEVGIAYSSAVVASGGTGPYTYSIPSGGLPAGLTLDSSTGDITGTPTSAATFNYTIKAVDSKGVSGTSKCHIKVAPSLESNCPPKTVVGFVGQPYSNAFVVHGGVAPFTFKIISGSLPPGLTLNTSTGVVSGTPTTAGTFIFAAQVTDSLGAVYNVNVGHCVLVIKPPTIALACASSTGQVGFAYSSALVATGGTPPYTFSISSGSLPPGLSLNTSTGAITGTPTMAGTFNFTAKVKDSTGTSAGTATASCSIVVSPPQLTMTCGTNTIGEVGVAFDSGPMNVTGGAPPYTFSIVGTLPTGLALNTSTGEVTGTPTTAGSFQIKVTDSLGNTSTNCTITINGPLQVTCGKNSIGEVGVAFDSGPMTVTGGVAPYTFSIVGTLPTGLALNTSTGDVSGTPTTAGSFQIKVTDSLGNSSLNCTITINGPLQITCGKSNIGEVGVAFDSGPMTVTGGVAPYTFSIVGTLPAGLTLNTSTGDVSGTPTVAGSFQIEVTDSLGNTSTNCTITIYGPLQITCGLNNIGEVGVAFDSGPMVVTGGVPPYTFSIVGTLPAGLILNTVTGEVTGTPTTAGTFQIEVTDSLGNSSTTCTITIFGPLQITCGKNDIGEVGVAFDSGPMTVTGGAPPYTFSIVGTLPAGLTLNPATGDISGTPTAAGTFQIEVTDSLGNSSTACTITIYGPLQVTCGTNNIGTTGAAFDSGPLTVTGGVPPYTFSIVGTLPAGLTLNPSNGDVSGTPTATGTFTVEVTDSVGNSSTSCTITINPGPPCGAPGLSLGTDSSYIFIDTGATHLGWNAYQLDGSVLFGQGLTVSLSGGNNGGLGAGYSVFLDPTVSISGNLQNPLTFVTVPTSQTAAAAATAQSVSTFASGLAATQTFTTINNNLTINGSGGLNVIDVGSIQNANLTINGSTSDYFVFNVTGGIQTNRVMTLTGGVTASHILWNLTGTGTVLQTSGGDVLVGTFLATDGGAFQFSELQLNGELINTGGNIQLVSGNHTLTQVGWCTVN